MLPLSCCRRLSRVQPRSVKSSFHLVGSTVAQRSGDVSPGNFGAVVACFASGALGKLGHLVFAGVIATVFHIYAMML